jgi:phenylalanyl-tRNA synthetase alpha subunit
MEEIMSEIIKEETAQVETPAVTEPVEKTFTQKDLDAIIDKRLARERKDAETRIKEAVTEAQKLAKMNADERAQHEREELQKTLSQREAEITKRELKAEAKSQLSDKGLPIELADALPLNDAESTSQAIEAIETAFRKAVEKGVNERLKGTAPKVGQPAPHVDEVDKLTAQYNEAVKAGKTVEAVALKNKLFKLEQEKK